MSVFSTAITGLIHFILTLTVVLAVVVGWIWLAKWRFDVPRALSDKDIDADLHHH